MNSVRCGDSPHYVQIVITTIDPRKQETFMERVKPRVATRNPSTSSGVMCPLCVRRSSSVTGLLSTWLLRDLSLFRTPPPGLRSRGGAAVPCPPPETFSATGASLRALGPLILHCRRLRSVPAGVFCLLPG